MVFDGECGVAIASFSVAPTLDRPAAAYPQNRADQRIREESREQSNRAATVDMRAVASAEKRQRKLDEKMEAFFKAQRAWYETQETLATEESPANALKISEGLKAQFSANLVGGSADPVSFAERLDTAALGSDRTRDGAPLARPAQSDARTPTAERDAGNDDGGKENAAPRTATDKVVDGDDTRRSRKTAVAAMVEPDDDAEERKCRSRDDQQEDAAVTPRRSERARVPRRSYS